MTKEPEPPPIVTTYKITRSCPICRKSIEIEINKGEPLPASYETICPKCENVVVLIKSKPKPKPKPKPLPKEMDYMQEYYKRMLEKGMP